MNPSPLFVALATPALGLIIQHEVPIIWSLLIFFALYFSVAAIWVLEDGE